MEYTVKKLGQLAGISPRTLRYYDEIDVLKPLRKSSSGYRIYGEKEVDKLQQILLYRTLGLDLESIKRILSDPSFEASDALKSHHEQLLSKREQLDLLITNVENTLLAAEGKGTMTDHEKFHGLKQKLVDENESKYGEEIREKYGNEVVDGSNAQMMKMSKEQFAEYTLLEEEIKKMLAEAFKTGDPGSEEGQKAAQLHKEWLAFHWSTYSKEAHAGLAQMYVDDERFRAYYDKAQPGTASFLRDAIFIYTGFDR